MFGQTITHIMVAGIVAKKSSLLQRHQNNRQGIFPAANKGTSTLTAKQKFKIITDAIKYGFAYRLIKQPDPAAIDHKNIIGFIDDNGRIGVQSF